MKYGTKKIQSRATEIKIVNCTVWYHRFKFQDCYRLINCILHFGILRMEKSNCFDIINSFCSTLNKLKITIGSSFAKLS